MPLRLDEHNWYLSAQKEHTLLPTTPEQEEDDITPTTQNKNDALLEKDTLEKDDILPTMQLVKSLQLEPGIKYVTLKFYFLNIFL